MTSAPSPAPLTHPSVGRPRLLVVDDDRGVRLALARALTRFDYDVVLAADGPDALDQLASDPDIAAVVSDLDMAPMDGVELGRRARQYRPALPIVFVTGRPRSVDLRSQPPAHVQAKPTDLTELCAALDTLVHRHDHVPHRPDLADSPRPTDHTGHSVADT